MRDKWLVDEIVSNIKTVGDWESISDALGILNLNSPDVTRAQLLMVLNAVHNDSRVFVGTPPTTRNPDGLNLIDEWQASPDEIADYILSADDVMLRMLTEVFIDLPRQDN